MISNGLRMIGQVLRDGLRILLHVIKLTPYIPVIILVLVVIQGCFAAYILQAFFAFTHETVVAEVVMSSIQTDANGSTYIDIEFIPYGHPSALDVARNGDEDTIPSRGEPETYRLYGDTVAIRGPLITLQPVWRMLGFENIYKLALIEGEYRLPGARGGEGTEISINGGIEESWWDRNNREANFPHNTVIKRITLSGDEEFGFVGDRRKLYEIVVTNDTITWNFIGYVDD